MSRVYGANPRPRILLEQIPEELHEDFRKRFPTVKAVTLRTEVDQAEYDVLVTATTAYDADAHLFVIVCSEPIGGRSIIDQVTAGDASFPVQWLGTSKGHEFHVATSIAPALQRFLEARMIPIVDRKAENRVMGSPVSAPGVITPFIVTARGEVLAGRFRRRSGTECWAFPTELVEYAAECLAIAVEQWREQDLTRFPYPLEDWSSDPRWLTREEDEVMQELRDLRQKRDQLLGQLAGEESTLESRFAEARTRSDATERQLLTA